MVHPQIQPSKPINKGERLTLKRVPKSWQYIPFNGGPRICIGQQFALTEMGYTIVRLFQEFEAIEPRMTKVQWMQTEIVGSPGEDVVLSFKPAKC
jgi:cytochrome P450